MPGTFFLPVLLLIHSPLVGSATWEPVARRLRIRRWRVIVPRLVDTDGENLPYWDRHARSVAEAIEHKAFHSTVVLVGHSGAGPLLPCIAEAIDRSVVGMVFVDAGIPKNGASRLDLLAKESGVEVADKLCAFFEAWRPLSQLARGRTAKSHSRCDGASRCPERRATAPLGVLERADSRSGRVARHSLRLLTPEPWIRSTRGGSAAPGLGVPGICSQILTSRRSLKRHWFFPSTRQPDGVDSMTSSVRSVALSTNRS